MEQYPPNLNWVFGEKAFVKIIQINHKLRSLVLKRFNEKTNAQLYRFSPWMCHEEKLPDLKKILEKTPPWRGKLLTDPSLLAEIQEVFTDSNGNLNLDLEQNFPIQIHFDSKKNSSSFEKAKLLLFQKSPQLKLLFEEMIEFIVPLKLPQSMSRVEVGFSSHLTKGAIFYHLAENETIENLAIDLAHELGHQVFMVYLSADRIFSSDFNVPVYSGVRKTLRPAIRSFHAAFALAYIWEATRWIFPEKTVPVQTSLLETVKSLRENAQFTPLGEAILRDFDTISYFSPQVDAKPLMV